MAAKVVSLRVDGLEDREIGWYAAAAIKDQAGLKYYGEYTRHLSNLRLSVRRLNAKLAKEGRLNAKDPKAKMLYVLNKALNRRRQGPRLGEISRRPSLAAKIDAQLEDIEEATRAHLSAKGIDFDKATKVEVEEGTRDINPKKYGWMGSKSSFVEGIYALLKSKKRATDADISSYLLARRTKRFQARNRRRLVNRQRQREAKETDDEL
jgi:AraC-like DNA-binding protein